MAATIIEKPAYISFAGNPVLAKVTTNLSGKTFLKICLRLEARLDRQSESVYSESFDFSMPTGGGAEAAVFDLSSALVSMLSQVEHAPCYGKEGTHSSGRVLYTCKAWDEYLSPGNTVVSTEGAAASTGTLVAIPGRYTDVERMKLPEDTYKELGEMSLLSSKPDSGETVPRNFPVVMPVFGRNGTKITVSAYKDSAVAAVLGSFQTAAQETAWGGIPLSPLTAGRYALSFPGTTIRPVEVQVIEEQPDATYFEFMNRFGGMESIVCYGRRSEISSTGNERDIRYSGNTFRPSARYFKRAGSEEQRIRMSTGPLTRAWAKWFVQEFFRAEQCWMLEGGGGMIPVIVETEDEQAIYDGGEAQVIDLEFEAVKCLNGYLEGNWH